MSTEAVDLAAVQADDALLDMLGSVGRTPADTDGELARVLAAWRREVHAGSSRWTPSRPHATGPAQRPPDVPGTPR